jgi:hypothetical protein
MATAFDLLNYQQTPSRSAKRCQLDQYELTDDELPDPLSLAQEPEAGCSQFHLRPLQSSRCPSMLRQWWQLHMRASPTKDSMMLTGNAGWCWWGSSISHAKARSQAPVSCRFRIGRNPTTALMVSEYLT